MTSHYLNQWWIVYRCIYASLGLNELTRYQVLYPTVSTNITHFINPFINYHEINWDGIIFNNKKYPALVIGCCDMPFVMDPLIALSLTCNWVIPCWVEEARISYISTGTCHHPAALLVWTDLIPTNQHRSRCLEPGHQQHPVLSMVSHCMIRTSPPHYSNVTGVSLHLISAATGLCSTAI